MHASKRSSSRSFRAALSVAPLLALLAAGGCDKPSHDKVDTWMRTEQGPGKLVATVKSSDVDADLRAHAAQNLVLMDRFTEAKEAIEPLPERERTELMAKLAPRLWESARRAQGQGEMAMPSPEQNMAKDALFELRAMAGPDTRTQIDGWLIEWLTAGYFEGLAKEGKVPARMIVREVGRPAAPKLLAVARGTIARPANADGSRPKVGDALLEALALTADPEAIGFVLDLSVGDFKDETLGGRATAALYAAFVEPPAGAPALDARTALLPHLDKLQGMLRNESLPGEMVNDAADLVRVIGPPECLPPLVDMIAYPHAKENYRWAGSQRALRCAGTDAIRPVVEALPTNVPFDRVRLEKYVWKEILAINAKAKVADEARALLGAKSWVARISGIEVLGALAARDRAAEDARKLRGLAGEPTRLTGWWGKGGGKDKKPDPTIGQVAAEVASKLEALATGSETK